MAYYYQLFSWNQEGDMMSLILFLLYTVQQIKAKLSESKGAKKNCYSFQTAQLYMQKIQKKIKLLKLINNLNKMADMKQI